MDLCLGAPDLRSSWHCQPGTACAPVNISTSGSPVPYACLGTCDTSTAALFSLSFFFYASNPFAYYSMAESDRGDVTGSARTAALEPPRVIQDLGSRLRKISGFNTTTGHCDGRLPPGFACVQRHRRRPLPGNRFSIEDRFWIFIRIHTYEYIIFYVHAVAEFAKGTRLTTARVWRDNMQYRKFAVERAGRCSRVKKKKKSILACILCRQ